MSKISNSPHTGSPPRAWGRLLKRRHLFGAPRFTPTRVGDDGHSLASTIWSCGSPPRAWGRRWRKARSIRSSAVHPHARGDDSRAATNAKLTNGSPHSRGDDFISHHLLEQIHGSSPRTWGRRGFISCEPDRKRFIPTRVGTTARGSIPPPRLSIYLHGCGGPRKLLGLVRLPGRFTPTRVGTTPPCSRPSPGRSVHPHARGDDLAIHDRIDEEHGSPPYAWGRPRGQYAHQQAGWFTPTRVGTTAANGYPAAVCFGSPPRAWGRPNCDVFTLAPPFGSSPRAWGRPFERDRASVYRRFTPSAWGRHRPARPGTS